MKKLLIFLFSLTTVLGFGQTETKIPLLQLYQSGATTNQVAQWNGTNWVPATINYQTVKDDGTSMTQRANLNFVTTSTIDAALTDNSPNTEVRLTVPTEAITSTQLATDAVTTVKVANSNITYGKIQNVTAARLLGNPTGSASAPSEISLGTNLGFTGTTLNFTGPTFATGTTDRLAVWTSSINLGVSNIISNSNGVAINAGGSPTGNFIIQGVSVVPILGRSNTGLGYGVFGTNSVATCDQNVAIGSPALGAITSGDFNIAVGYNALLADTSGSSNAAIGYETLKRLVSGSNNLAIGNGALQFLTTTSDNVGIGGLAGYNLTGTGVIAIGGQALRSSGGTANINYTVAIGNGAGGQFTTVTGSNNVYIGGFSGANMSSGGSNIFLGYQSGNSSSYATLSNRFVVDNTNTSSPMLSGDMNLNMIGINKDITGTLGATLDVKSNSTSFSNKALNLADSGGSVFWDVRDNGNAGFGITAQSSNKLAIQQSASGTQVALLLRNGVDEDGQGIGMEFNNAGNVHGRIIATNPTGGLTSALDIYTPDNSGTLSSFHTMQRDGSQNQLHKAIYYDVYNGTSTTETLTGLVSIVNVPSTATTTTINLPEIVTGVPGANQVNIGYVLELSIDNASAITVQRAGASDVIMVDGSTSTVTSIVTTGGTYYVKRFIAAESNKWIVF